MVENPWIGQFISDSNWSDIDGRTHRRHVVLQAGTTKGNSLVVSLQGLVDETPSYNVECGANGFVPGTMERAIGAECSVVITGEDGQLQRQSAVFYAAYVPSADVWRISTAEGDITVQRTTAPVDIPDVNPVGGSTAKVTNEADVPGRDVAGGVNSGVVGSGGAPNADQAYFDFQVEKPVAPIPGSGAPRYPDILRSAGVEGEVLAQFVVDTSGRVDISSYKVIRTSHELFAASLWAALPAMRFMPAEVGGRKVKQLVQQPFVFALQR